MSVTKSKAGGAAASNKTKPISTTPNSSARNRAYAIAAAEARTGIADHEAVTGAVLAYIETDPEAKDEMARLGAYQISRDAFHAIRQAAMRAGGCSGSGPGSSSRLLEAVSSPEATRAAQIRGIDRKAAASRCLPDPLDWILPGTYVSLRRATLKDLQRSERLCSYQAKTIGANASFLGAVASYLERHKKAKCVGDCLDSATARSMAEAAGVVFG